MAESATVGQGQKLEAEDLVTENLVHQVSKFVDFQRLRGFARELNVPQAEYLKITAPNFYTQSEQCFKVRITPLCTRSIDL